MNPSDYIKQAIDFNKTAFSNAYDTTVMIQDQFEKTATSMLAQANWIPDEGRKALDEYTEAYKSNRDQYKSYMDESFKRAEEILVK